MSERPRWHHIHTHPRIVAVAYLLYDRHSQFITAHESQSQSEWGAAVWCQRFNIYAARLHDECVASARCVALCCAECARNDGALAFSSLTMHPEALSPSPDLLIAAPKRLAIHAFPHEAYTPLHLHLEKPSSARSAPTRPQRWFIDVAPHSGDARWPTWAEL